MQKQVRDQLNILVYTHSVELSRQQKAINQHQIIDHSYEEEKPVGASPGALWNVPSVGWSEAFLELRQCVASVS